MFINGNWGRIEDQLQRQHLDTFYNYVEFFCNSSTIEFKEYQMNIPYFQYMHPNFTFGEVIETTISEKTQQIQKLDASMKSPPKNFTLEQLQGYKNRLEIEIKYFESFRNLYLQQLYSQLYFEPRYSDIYSFLWNSVFLDLNQNLNIPFISNEPALIPYPASMIRMPEWTEFGKTMSFSSSWARNNMYNDFVLSSAPVHDDLMLSPNDPYSIPQKIILSQMGQFIDEQSQEVFTSFNPKDLNMIYFFKLLFDQNIKMIVAVCADFAKMMNPKDGRIKVEYTESLSVMNKCHLYWRTTLELHLHDEVYTITSQPVTNPDSIKLYNTYDLTISKNDSDFEWTVTVFVLANWPDHQPLPHTDPDNNMLEDLLSMYSKMFQVLNENKTKEIRNRVLVHCSAGVGRTGTTILGYQMYQDMRNAMKKGQDSDNFNFHDFIKDYKADQFLAPKFVNSAIDYIKNHNNIPQEQKTSLLKNMEETNTVFKESKLMHYMFDSLIYYRFRRRFFIQTDDQFFFFFYYAQNLTVSKIRKTILENQTSSIQNDTSEVQDNTTQQIQVQSKHFLFFTFFFKF